MFVLFQDGLSLHVDRFGGVLPKGPPVRSSAGPPGRWSVAAGPQTESRHEEEVKCFADEHGTVEENIL